MNDISIEVWGHRGIRHDRFPEKYPDAAHENSLYAFEYALKRINGLETDIILSKQKTPYLTHDTLFSDQVHYELKIHLDKPSQDIVGSQFIYQMDDADIAKLKLVDGQDFTRLDKLFALLKTYPGRTINLELKGPNTNDVAVASVEKAIGQGLVTAENILFSGFDLPRLRQLREKVGNTYKIGALFARNDQTRTFMFPGFPDAPQDAFYVPFKLEEGVMDHPDLRAINPDYFNLEYKTLTDAGLKAIEKFNPNAKIILWPAGEPHPDEGSYLMDVIEHFAPSGKIHAVMSDFPEILQRRLQEKGWAALVPPAA